MGGRIVGAGLGVSALECAADIERLTDINEIDRRFMREISQHGLDHVSSAEIPPITEPLEAYLHISTMPAEFSARYAEKNYVVRDPVAIAAVKCDFAFTWRTLCSPHLFKPRDLEIMYEPREYGILDGIVLPQRHADGSLGVIGLSGESVEMSRAERADLLFLMSSLYMRLKSLVGSERKTKPRSAPDLSPRERECLHWAALGKSDWDIGDALSIAESTAHRHIENAKRKFGVTTRIQAVVMALKLGEVCP